MKILNNWTELLLLLQSKSSSCSLYLKYITCGRWEEKQVSHKQVKLCKDFFCIVLNVCKDLKSKNESLYNSVFVAIPDERKKEYNPNMEYRGETLEFHAALFPNKKDILISYNIKGKDSGKQYAVLIAPHILSES